MTLVIGHEEHLDVIPPDPLERFRFLKKDKSLRSNTFKKFNTQSSEKGNFEQLIDDGYIYVGNGKSAEFQCTHCGNIMKCSNGFEDIYKEHRRFFPNCPFRRDITCSDFMASLVEINGISRDVEDYTKKKIYNKNIYEKYRNYNDRLESFANWSEEYPVSREDCAKAGLYHTGSEDLCICYYCGGQLVDWEQGDQPQTEHDSNFSSICGLVDLTDR